MALYKMVDGEKVKISAEEEKTFHEIWGREKREYRGMRQRRYPPIGDQMDVLYKTMKHLKSQGINIGLEAEDWIAQIDFIKAAFPKSKDVL